MRQFIAPTEDYIKLETSELAADVVAGSNITLTLLDNSGFAINQFVVIGDEGVEKTELEQINQAVAGNTDIRVATLKFSHKAGTKVTKYRYNQRKFYGCTTSDGTYVELTADGSPKAIEVDDPQGTIFEYSGTTYNYFKATYYNSATVEETDIADSLAVIGNQSGRYTTLSAIRIQAGLKNNKRIDDGRIEEKRKQAENEVNSAIFNAYVLPLSEVPDLITRVTTLLAAGYIGYEEYPEDIDPKKWLGEARAILKAISSSKQRLIAADGTELARVTSSNQLAGYPDTDYDANDDDSPFQAFTRNQKF